jgi:hypothetical protein
MRLVSLDKSQPIPRGPASIRENRKVAPSLTHLRDVNRCEVRPLDLITHQGFAVLVTDTRGTIQGGTQGFFPTSDAISFPLSHEIRRRIASFRFC